MHQLLRKIPAIHELQQDQSFLTLLETNDVSKGKLTEWLQEAVSDLRNDILAGNFQTEDDVNPLSDIVFSKLSERLSHHSTYQLRRVINGTGTVLHTNLGRARLSDQAVKQVVETAFSYSNLEYNLKQGKRGSRHDLIEELVKEITGAEAAMVVNNNAAAVYLVLKALAKGKEVIVSRGELVEIGGSFRVSSIMEESGATLVEVGTTNKTHLYDYEDAISEETVMMMKVHTSNFKVIGFTKEVSVAELRPLAQTHNVILYEDLGSGAIYDLKKDGIGNEPTVSEALKKGADIVTFSGDKLLGGPQAGVIAGKKEWIDRLKKHQLARVLRVDKMTLAALEATLKAYVNEDSVREELPTLRAILLKKDEVASRIEEFTRKLSSHWRTNVKSDVSQVGGGTMPDVELDTLLLLLSCENHTAQSLHNKLRSGEPAVVSRIINDQIAFDFRTIETHEFEDLHKRLKEFE
ncbi:L-seryl-tRNA(Sec) selenium transferase [Alkalihalobacillus sp. MEB130]|uniref:L-seryl-tRNA(Sec) selenium transferase n=1 Tax=Alkalihalobacillus sp. MEB130 TaxID=2976704 RepID=UPI0028DFBC80|nr:L-seryl-tRNA(Sec) selenium transferase [Alkalihalobacillus sp. MEB130]MDT8860562.1 L-seryl-tRNA(Sec) selenium transferase [Alkalihalobacillus sp. MEB130]